MAEERATLEDALLAIEGTVGVGLRPRGVQAGETVGAPLPNVARQVVEAKAVRRKTPGGREAQVSVLIGVVVRKRPLPDVAPVLPLRFKFIPPGKGHGVQPTSCRIFPFRFGGQPPSCPRAIDPIGNRTIMA